MDLKRARILVTGGAGFVGSHVVEALRQEGASSISVPRSRDCDLRVWDAADRLLREERPDLLLHLAARVGGIGANLARPGTLYYENVIMGTQIIELARRHGVAKVVTIGSADSYPGHAPVPFREEQLWDGYPIETHASYGIALKMLLVQAQAYRKEFGLNAIHLIPTNLYGPRCNFDPATCHVIPALIRRVTEARDRGVGEIVCWGDGSPTRDFLYVEDAARAIVRAAATYDDACPVNLSSGREVSIAETVTAIARLSGYRGRIAWDPSRPGGQARRCLDPTRARERLGWSAGTPLEEGLRRTIRWFEEARPEGGR